MLDEVVVRQPDYFTALAEALDEVAARPTGRPGWPGSVVRARAPYLLSKAFVDENFAFYGTTLTGAPEQRARWKRGVGGVEGALGEAVGKLYVERALPARGQGADGASSSPTWSRPTAQDIEALDWMSAETKARALDKLGQVHAQDRLPGPVARLLDARDRPRRPGRQRPRGRAAFELDRELAKLGKPVDRDEWLMTPQTVNAYYNPGMNEIVFPAAILQPPFFDLERRRRGQLRRRSARSSATRSATASTTRARKYDGDGNLNDWWTDADRARVRRARAKRLIEQYDALRAAPDCPASTSTARSTIGENIGDLGGLTIAYKAYADLPGRRPSPR